MSGQSPSPPYVRQLVDRLNRPVLYADRQRAALHVLDWLGCAAAGAREPAGRILLDRSVSDAASAAFAWGGLGNVLEMDDVDKRAILHPGPSIVPAILALARLRDLGLAGTNLLSALVWGYEATIQLGRATGAGHYALWHSTGTCGAIGAAAACAHLLGLDDEETAHALALAVSQSAGFWQTRHEPGSMGKQLHTAHAARAGLEAADLAACGFRGPLSILEGPQGFFAATCPDGDPDAVVAEPAAPWRLHEVSFKPWPACRHAHAAIDAALLARGAVSLEDVKQPIAVRTYPDALTFCDKPNPKTVIEAKFSLQHSVAVTLLRGAPSLADFTPHAIHDPAIAAWRANVQVAVGETYADAYPARYGAELVVSTAKGDCVFAAPDALGDPENPVSRDQLIEKAVTLLEAGGWSGAEAKALCAAVFALAEDGPLAPLWQALDGLGATSSPASLSA